MIWTIDKFKTRLRLEEGSYDLDVPIQIEIEYQLEGQRVHASSISRKIRYNRPLLIKESPSRSAAELDRIINQEVQDAIQRHFASRGLALVEE
jgi:hypothetical protein